MNPALLHALRFGVSGNSACTPTFIRVEFSTGESVEFNGEVLTRLNDDLATIVRHVIMAHAEKEPIFDSEEFRNE